MQRRPQMTRRPSVGGNRRQVQIKPPAPRVARKKPPKKSR